MKVVFFNQDTKEEEFISECDTVSTTTDLSKVVECPTCHKRIRYGEAFTSRNWFDMSGNGVPECEDCYALYNWGKNIDGSPTTREKEFYFVIKYGDHFLTKIGCDLTTDLGQARLYRKLDTWNRTRSDILLKLAESYGNEILTQYRLIRVSLQEEV